MMTMASGAKVCKRFCTSGARIFSGWWTGMPAASAASLTGDEEICWPRPRGRSGCVITATISKSDCERRCWSEGTAKAGVPQKRRRSGATSSPLALFFQFFDFALDEVALEHAEMLDEENAVEVVDFMAEGAGEQIFAADLEGLALGVLRFYGDELRSNDVATKPGNREAAFFLAFFTFSVNDFGIGENDFRLGIFSAGDIDDSHAQGHADLRGSQADALSGVHGGKHIFGKLREPGIKGFYRRGRFFKNGIPVFDDFVDFSGGRDGFHRGGSLGWFRTRRFVGHSCQNSAASRRANLLQIFAEKHRRAQEQPWLRQ